MKEDCDSLFACPLAVFSKYCEHPTLFEGQPVIPLEKINETSIKLFGAPEDDEDKELTEGNSKFPLLDFLRDCISLIPCVQTVPNVKIDCDDSWFIYKKAVFSNGDVISDSNHRYIIETVEDAFNPGRNLILIGKKNTFVNNSST